MVTTEEKIKKMLDAKYSVFDCEEKQFMFMGMPTPNPEIQSSYPFCNEHCMKIMMREIPVLKLKDGTMYGQQG